MSPLHQATEPRLCTLQGPFVTRGKKLTAQRRQYIQALINNNNGRVTTIAAVFVFLHGTRCSVAVGFDGMSGCLLSVLAGGD